MLLVDLFLQGDIGDGDPTHHVRAITQSKHGNVYTDTSSSASVSANVIEYAIKHAGADKILFGSDTPNYFTGMQRARIDYVRVHSQPSAISLGTPPPPCTAAPPCLGSALGAVRSCYR